MTKKIFLASIATGLFLMLAVGFANANLIQNGTFDSNGVLTPWVSYGNNTVTAGVVQIGAPGANVDSGISQLFVVDTSTLAVDISFDYQWYGNDNTALNDVFAATFSYLDTSSGWNDIELLNESNNDGNFSTRIYFSEQYPLSNLSGSNPNAKIEFSLIESASTETIGTRIELDNVSVTAAPIPEPSTMLLLGVGLIGLAGATRRKLKK